MTAMADNVYAHFHSEEHPFIDRLIERLERVSASHEPYWSDFLDPRQQYICQSLVNRQGNLFICFEGGHEQAERKRAWIAPDYMVHGPADIVIELLHLYSLDERLTDLRHGDYLGALLGLGIKREKVGDLYIFEDGCHILLAAEMASFVELHLRQAGRARLQIERLPLQNLRFHAVTFQEFYITVSSLRLDGIVSDVCKMSRSKALLPIKAGRCRVNWRVEESPATLLRDGDTISLQGWGRFRLLEVQGMTKKGNIRVKVGKFS